MLETTRLLDLEDVTGDLPIALGLSYFWWDLLLYAMAAAKSGVDPSNSGLLFMYGVCWSLYIGSRTGFGENSCAACRLRRRRRRRKNARRAIRTRPAIPPTTAPTIVPVGIPPPDCDALALVAAALGVRVRVTKPAFGAVGTSVDVRTMVLGPLLPEAPFCEESLAAIDVMTTTDGVADARLVETEVEESSESSPEVAAAEDAAAEDGAAEGADESEPLTCCMFWMENLSEVVSQQG